MHPVIGGIYEHYKGKRYRVLGTARHSETLEQLIYYECLYDNPEGRYWVRPADMFFSTVEQNGTTVPRFALISAT